MYILEGQSMKQRGETKD